MRKLERLMKALANRRRMEIIRYLFQHKKSTVGILSEHLKLSFKSTSKHLGSLKSTEIIDGEQSGLSIYYSLSEPIHPIVKLIISNI